MKIQKLTALLAAIVLLTAASAKEGRKEAKKELSNTRIANCLVKITCDPAVLPLSLETIDHLLHSSGVGGKAIREVFGVAALPGGESEGLVDFGIEPLSEEPSSDEPKAGGRMYGVTPDAEFEREIRAFGRKKQVTPIPDGPTYASEQILFFQLAVELEPDDIKPAAEEFMKALIDNLHKTLNAAFKDYSKRFRMQLAFAQKDTEDAERDLRRLQGTLRSILGSYNLEREVILDDINRSREEWRDTEMELETNEAFVNATSKRIAETEKKMMNKLANDPVLAELQKMIKIHEERGGGGDLRGPRGPPQGQDRACRTP
jgi:hypothetical protein